MSRKGRKNLTYKQRLQLEAFFYAKLPKKEIAKLMNLNLSTVYREFNRGSYEHTLRSTSTYDYFRRTYYRTETRYSAIKAQDKYNTLCEKKGAPLKIKGNNAFIAYLEKRFEDGISPSAVAGELKAKKNDFSISVSKQTLYRYVKNKFFKNIRMAKRKQKYKKSVKTAKTAPRGLSIDFRPKEIDLRNSFGHWEMDCVCGPTRTSLLVLSERLTRKEIIIKIENQQAQSVVNSLDELERRLGSHFKQIFKSITVDNGVEFSDTAGLERSLFGSTKRTVVFYCHPYRSNERGTNERLNREIRRKLPKGTDFSKIDDFIISSVEKWINAYPREVLGYRSSDELFAEELKKLNCTRFL